MWTQTLPPSLTSLFKNSLCVFKYCLSQSCSGCRPSISDTVDVLKTSAHSKCGVWKKFRCQLYLFVYRTGEFSGWISELEFGQNHQNSHTCSYMKMTISSWALYLSFISSVSEKTKECIVPTVPPSYNVITASAIVIIIFIVAITLTASYFRRHGKFSSFFYKQSLTAYGVSM